MTMAKQAAPKRVTRQEIARYERIINDRTEASRPRIVSTARPEPAACDLESTAPQLDQHVRDARRVALAERKAKRAREGHVSLSKAARKRALQQARRDDETKRRMSLAKVEWDPRTAQGRREFDVTGEGKGLRASLNHFNNCFKAKLDRSDSRVLAWAKVDELQQRVHAGDIPPPKFEPGVDTSTLPGIQVSRLAAITEDQRLRRWVGKDGHDLLVAIVFHQRGYRELAGEHLDERLVAGMFKRALDQAAFAFGIGPDPSLGSDMNRALRGVFRS